MPVALIDRVKYEGPDASSVLVWKWPGEDLVLGTQLIVGPSQEALFVKGGQALDVFGPGTHTLATENIPLLRKLVNLPFGGKTPFTAEIYYVNKHAKLDMKWGTADPLRVQDPTYHVILPVRSFGQMGIRVTDTRSFITQIVGTLGNWSSDRLSQYFDGLIVTRVKDTIAKYIVERRISVMEIGSKLDELSRFVGEAVSEEFGRFGVEIVNFYVMSVNVPSDDPSVKRLQEIMVNRAEFEQLGQAYRVKRTFDTLDRLADNSASGGAALLAEGLGLGLGVTAGARVGDLVSDAFSRGGPEVGQTSTPTADPAQRLAKLKSLLEAGLITQADYDERKRKILEEI